MLMNININLTLGQALGAFAANIRVPDGTLRMVISSAARAPGTIVKGHEQPHPTRQSAGMIFYKHEGTENGGLIFDGRRDAAGTALAAAA